MGIIFSAFGSAKARQQLTGNSCNQQGQSPFKSVISTVLNSDCTWGSLPILDLQGIALNMIVCNSANHSSFGWVAKSRNETTIDVYAA